MRLHETKGMQRTRSRRTHLTVLGLAAALVALLGLVGACAIEELPVASSEEAGVEVVDQPVVVQPVFVVSGLDELPADVRIDELHLGVGAIFLDRVDTSDDGVAFANQTPFSLHFDIRDGELEAYAPTMTLPRGGRYQISVQVEPQHLLGVDIDQAVRQMASDASEASLLVTGTYIKTRYEAEEDEHGEIRGRDKDNEAEPAPLPWVPNGTDDVGRLLRDVERIPFTYSSQRTLRFILDEIDLRGGEENDLILELRLGPWVEEAVKPAISELLETDEASRFNGEEVENINIYVEEDLGELEDGIGGLIGAIDVYVD